MKAKQAETASFGVFTSTVKKQETQLSYLNSICLSIRLAVTTRGSRPVDREWSSRLEEMS